MEEGSLMKKGIFCLSIDTELLWGRKDNPQPFFSDTQKAKMIIKKLLFLFDKYQIPATWAIVGELFNEGDPLWHGPDIIKMIKTYPNQEIACHTYSHEVFDEKKLNLQEAETEIKKCLKVTRPLRLRSFVFPKNIIGHLEVLKKYGFCCFRGPEPYWFSKISKRQKLFQILDFLLLLSPPISKPSKHSSGLINIPGSMLYISSRGLRKFLPVDMRVIKAKKGIKKANKIGGVFHLWFHPIDFARETEKMFLGLEEILKYAAKLRKENKLEIKSMGQITEDFLKQN